MAFRRDKALQAAQQHAARGDLASACREYQTVVEHDPNDVQTWLLLADSLHRAGDVAAAVDRYAHAANILLETGEVPKALQIFRQVLHLAPERYDSHMRAAQAFEQLRRYPEAVALYEKVAGVYLRSGNTREALMLYERVADLMPREVAKRLRLAELFSRERRTDEAIDQFQRGADFLKQAGRTKEFIRVAERLLYHRPADAVARDLVRAYLEVGQGRRALMKLNELLQRSKNDPEGLELLAETFMSLNRVNKACSVVLELVKHQRDAGPEGVSRCVRVLRKATGWAPDNAEIAKTLAEFGDVAEEFEEIEEFDEIEELDEFEELDEDVVELEPVAHQQVGRPSAPPPQTEDEAPIQRRRSLTQEVISEGDQQSGASELVDIDKQLEEVRVLMKYHLYEHALGHAEQILGAEPMHAQGLELAAEILAALGRNAEAADARASLASQLVTHDPAAAARHVELALALIPDHPLAVRVGEQLSEISGVDVGVAQVEDARPARVDPLGALDFDDDFAIESSESLVSSVVDDLGADFDPSEQSGYQEDDTPALPEDDDSDTIDISAADPGLHGDLAALTHDDDDFSIDLQSSVEEIPEEEPVAVEDRFGFGDDDDDAETGFDEGENEVDDGDRFSFTDDDDDTPLAAEGEPMVGRVEPDADAGERDDSPFGVPDDDEDEVAEEVTPEPEPEPQDWPDLEAETDEIEFYLAQDLEDDALAAFNDLVELYPGHPDLIALAPRFGIDPATVGGTAAAEAEADDDFDESEQSGIENLDADAAAPLLDLEDEDDDDDFLAAIFDEEAPRTRKKREVAIQTEDVGDADASDHFDLGTAYREMGLFDKAFSEYEAASSDPRWQAKALVMMGTIRAQSGDPNSAADLFGRAIEAARTKDERCEANYELAMVMLGTGDVDAARAALEAVEPGFRDRDDQLAQLS